MNILNSLYTRLVAGLVLMLLLIGAIYTALNVITAQRFIAKLDQDLHRTLAQNLVADKNLVAEGKLDSAALKKTFQQYMVVNPSIEIYLLDMNGKLLSYSADPGVVMRDHVSLDPIRSFLSGAEKYPLGDDPRSHDRKKAFSVTEVPSGEAPEGYLYVVLRGEQYEELESMAFQGFWARAGLWSMLLSLVIGLALGLLIFYWLTKRLRRVSRRIEAFSDSDFRSLVPKADADSGDEIAQIEQVFEQMAGRIQSQLSALQDKDTQRRQLVAQVSHDLRTPLASMLGYIESLQIRRDRISEQQQADFLDIAYTQGRRLSDMVDSLFQLSSLEAKEVKPHLEPFMPAELLFDIRQKYAIRLSQAGLSLEITGGHLGGFAQGDISLFERVLDNLIDNAIVHAEDSSVIRLHIENEEGEVRISVINQGRNIDERDIESLFDPFYRAAGGSADQRHAGLGLAISKRIMESLDGGIAVVNTAEGVVFTVTLPMASPDLL